jgi:hypothetical protein
MVIKVKVIPILEYDEHMNADFMNEELGLIKITRNQIISVKIHNKDCIIFYDSEVDA